MFDKKMLKNLDWVFLLLLVLLLGASLLVLASASGNIRSDPYYYMRRQLLFLGVGVGAMLFLTWFNYRDYGKYVRLAYVGLLVLLVGVFFAPGTEGDDAMRWYHIGSFMFQPSELGKLIVIVTLADYLSRRQESIKEWRVFWGAILITAVPMFLVLLEPDLGTALVYGFVLVVMMWLSGLPRRRVLAFIMIILLLVAFVYVDLYFATDGFSHLAEELPIPLPLRTYQLNRLIIFVNPEMDPLDTGYHIIQSKVAIGSGGMFGKGYGAGTQVQSNFLPTHHTDFIFSVVGEELGFVGAVGVLLLFMLLMLRMVRIAVQSADMFGSLLVSGLVAMLLFQVFVNVGMTVGLMPITGITLPMFSYGGTSLLINMLAMGMVFSVNIRREIKIF